MYISNLKALSTSTTNIIFLKDFSFWFIYRIITLRYWKVYSSGPSLAITYRDFRIIFLCLISIKLLTGGTLANERFILDFSKYDVPPFLQKLVEYLPRHGYLRLLPFFNIELVLSQSLVDELSEIRKNGDLLHSLDRVRVSLARNKVYFEKWLNADSKLTPIISDFLHIDDESLNTHIDTTDVEKMNQKDVSKFVTLYTSSCYTAMSISLALCLVFSLTSTSSRLEDSKSFFGSKFSCNLGENDQYQTLILDAIFKLIGSPNTKIEVDHDERRSNHTRNTTHVPNQPTTDLTATPAKNVNIQTNALVDKSKIIKIVTELVTDFILKNKLIFTNEDYGGLRTVSSP